MMIPPRFEYFAPSSVDEAVRLLDRFGGEAKVLAGGQSLLPVMKLRLAEPKALVDINRIPDLGYIREDAKYLRIGAIARTNDLNDSELIHRRYPILSDAAYEIADPLVRNMGTVGGNVSHGDPANDLPACMLALGAQFVVRGPRGERTIDSREFYQDTFVTALEPNEILTEIQIPRAREGQGSAYVKLEKRVGDFPIVGVAANLVLGPRRVIETAGIGLTAVGPTALKATEAEAHLVGKPAEDAALAEAAGLAEGIAKPVSDLRGPAEYKRAMVRVLARKALLEARDRARGGA
jgi:carbon-monoxide dehydrogenase medium subunit